MKKIKFEIDPMGTQRWILNKEIHREDGPAVVYEDGYKAWWKHGRYIKEERPK